MTLNLIGSACIHLVESELRRASRCESSPIYLRKSDENRYTELRSIMAALPSQPKETECAVCTNDFTTPKILPCGHLLCRDCVISWVDQKPDAGCPLCRFPIADPQVCSERSSADVADVLPTDFVMKALVENARVLAKDPVCCVCDDVKAESICLHCLDMLCPACTKAHKKLAVSRSHDVESLSSVTLERLTSSRPALCADHKADVFCVDHGLAVCTSCSVSKHRECQGVRDLQTQMKSTDQLVSELIDFIINTEHNLEAAIAQVDMRIVEVNDSEQKDTAKVDFECDRLQKLVEEYRKKLKEMSRKSHSEVRESLYDLKTSLGQLLGIVASHKHIVARARSVAPRPALIDATKVLQDRINSLNFDATPQQELFPNPSQSSRWCEDVVRRVERELHIPGEQKTEGLVKAAMPETISSETQTFWLQWVEAAFPHLDSRVHFLPPVHGNPVTTGQSSAGQLPAVPNTDIRDLQRVLCCLQKMSEQNREVLVAMSHLQFGQYLGQTCYTTTAAYMTNFSNIPIALSENLADENFHVCLIHRQYGLVALEVMCFGENLEKLKISPLNLGINIRKKLKEGVTQLDKAESMLSHVVANVSTGLRVTKTVAFPNLTARQVQQAISGDTQLTRDVCRCLGITDPANITGLCLCSDQLSDPITPLDVSKKVLRELGNWWQRRVAVSGPDSHMTCDLYKTLVARLCGLATTVAVPCTSPPRLCVKTLGQAVSLTGECFTAHITLFPEQVHLLNTAPPRLFVSGPPGTGKTVVLFLMAIQWLRCGNDVYIVSTWRGSRAVCILLYHLLQQSVNSQDTGVVVSGQPHILHYNLNRSGEAETAVNGLSQAARGGSLYVITDAAGPQGTDIFQTFCDRGDTFQTFCDKLLTQVPRLHLWAASCFHRDPPAGWQVEYLTRPLRSPPAVVREVKQDKAITKTREVQAYRECGMPGHTDGPPVRRLYHQGEGHPGRFPSDCVTCGREVASFLHSLRVGIPVNATTTSLTPPCLQWRDVLVLCRRSLSYQSGVMTGLTEAGIPVRVMNDGDTDDVAMAYSDVVWVAGGHCVEGLERKVVVCLNDDDYTQFHLMSRCTSQLVIVTLSTSHLA